MQAIEERNAEVETLREQLNNATGREKKKIEKEIKKLEKMNKKSEFWGNLANKTESTGQKLQQTGSKMTKVGLKTTAAVWTPPIFLGYLGVKAVKKNKNSTPEDDLIELVKECKQAHKEGKIDEDTMKDYITDFVNEYYRK